MGLDPRNSLRQFLGLRSGAQLFDGFLRRIRRRRGLAHRRDAAATEASPEYATGGQSGRHPSVIRRPPGI